MGDEPSLPLARPELDGWLLAGHIASGGFADVYRARRAGSDVMIAIKVARRPGDPRFARERSGLFAVGPGVAPGVVDTGVTPDGRPWIALEYLRGSTLGVWMAALPGTGACEPDRALSLLTALAGVVDRMHAAGVVHRDLTPDNVIVGNGDGDRVALIDFGLAVAASHDSWTSDRSLAMDPGWDEADDQLTATGQRLGTVLYAAPEQLADARSAGPAADRYALAAVAFELLAGRPPFIGTAGEVEQAHASRRVPRVSALAALPEGVDRVLARGMAKDPAERYPNAAAFVVELVDAIGGEERTTTRNLASSARPAEHSSRRVAVLGTYAMGGARQVAAAVADEHGRVIRLWGGRVIVAFDHADSPAAGIRAALRAARGFSAPARAVMHVVDVQPRRGAGRTGLASPELDAPGWLPSVEAWERGLEPIVLTEAAGAELSGYGDAASAPGYLVPPVEDAPAVATGRVALRGCDHVVKDVIREARHCMGARAPGLCVITADVGLGKSRVLGHVADVLALAGRVVQLRATASTAGGPFLARLASLALGVDVLETDPDVVRAACEQVAGTRGVRGWSALAERIGALPGGASQIPTVPGASRLAIAELIAEGLRASARERSLAVLIDDADRVDAVCLDAIELATLADAGAGPWVLLAGSAGMLANRPDLGRRAARHGGHELTPLEAGDARALLRDLLYPVERTPEATLSTIEQLANGVPLYLVEIVDALRAGGAIRRRRGTGAWFLAGDDLLHLSTTPLAERLAARKLGALPMALRSFAVTAATLGAEFRADQVEAVRARVESSGALDYGDLDSGAAVARLVHHGLLRELGSGLYAFRHPMLRTGIEASTDSERRRGLHGAVYNWLVETGPASGAELLARQAHHAAASGYRRASVRGWLAAADADARAHEHVRAERHFTAALAQLAQLDPTGGAGVGDRNVAALRLTALSGRGIVRCRLERWDEALADIDAAHEIARAVGDDATAAGCLLDKAMVLDWTYRWAEAVKCVDHVGSLVSSTVDRRLEARLHLARGRCAYRDGRRDEALALLETAADAAREVGDHETRVVALLLISMSLIYLVRPADAEARFAEVIALCEEIGDVLHLTAALGNRIILWKSLGHTDRAIADGRRTVELARTLGHATLESTAGHNLAELLYFQGETDEALDLAARARDLFHRHQAEPGPEFDLLVARIRAALGEDLTDSDTIRTLRACPEDTWSEKARVVFDALLLAADDATGWRDVLERARPACRAFPDEHIDVLLMAMRAAAASGRDGDLQAYLAQAREIPECEADSWRTRLAPFAERTTSPGTQSG